MHLAICSYDSLVNYPLIVTCVSARVNTTAVTVMKWKHVSYVYLMLSDSKLEWSRIFCQVIQYFPSYFNENVGNRSHGTWEAPLHVVLISSDWHVHQIHIPWWRFPFLQVIVVLWWTNKIPFPRRDSNSDPLVVQPVASRYADWAIHRSKTIIY
jgi:hypothetical protein